MDFETESLINQKEPKVMAINLQEEKMLRMVYTPRVRIKDKPSPISQLHLTVFYTLAQTEKELKEGPKALLKAFNQWHDKKSDNL